MCVVVQTFLGAEPEVKVFRGSFLRFCAVEIGTELHHIITIHPIAPVYISPENTHKLMGFYMEVLILGVIL